MIYGILSRSKKLFLILILLSLMTALFAQASGAGTSGGSGSSKFRQRLEWNADKNAFEYKVEIRQGGKILQTLTTSDNYVSMNLLSGSYEYRVSVYDFLGRVQDVSAWQKFVISKANIPSFENVADSFEVDVSSDNKIVLPLEVENVAAGTTVTLVNVKTGEKIAGTLVLSGAFAGKSEVGKASAEFSKIPEGQWKLLVENPSGLKAESPVIAIKAKVVEPEPAEPAEVAPVTEVAEVTEPEPEPEPEPELTPAPDTELAELTPAATDDEPEELDSPELDEAATDEESEDLDESEDSDDSAKVHKALGLEIKVGGALELSLFNDDLLSLKTYDSIFSEYGKEKFNLAPYAAISLVPDFGWLLNPGIEVSTHAFMYRSVPGSSVDNWEYCQTFTFWDIQASLVGQIRVHPQKFFINLKAGAGLENIWMQTTYSRDYYGREPKTEHAYYYPKVNAGLSMEWVPAKHLVIEIGADYNKILSSKVNVSYILPYLSLGVRF